MTALRLTLTVKDYPEGPRWTWTLHSGRHIVSTSGAQLFSRRVDCARGAEVGAGLEGVRDLLAGRPSKPGVVGNATRWTPQDWPVDVAVVVCDERGAS